MSDAVNSPVRPWRRVAGEMAFEHPLLKVERQEIAAGEDRREVVAIHTGNWVNVIPMRDDGHVVLIRQWRFGIAAPTLEIPGGVIDPGETAFEAAKREMLEETGYRAAGEDPARQRPSEPGVHVQRVLDVPGRRA